MAQKDLKERIGSVKNIQKITRAMEMVAAARLRRAEQRIEHLRPYAAAIRRMTRLAAEAAENIPRMPILQQRDEHHDVGLLFVTGDRGLAGAFNSQIIRAGLRAAAELESQGITPVYYASGKRGVSSLTFRQLHVAGSYVGFTDRPAYANAREIAENLMAAYVDGKLDRVEILYNGYISPLSQEVRREVLLPLQEATILEEGGAEESARGAEGDELEGSALHREEQVHHALVEYEPDAERILHRLIPDYVEISIFRALLESTASEHGARMTAMRNASQNASELIDVLTLQANRARQAEITQEILEVVAGAEALG
jgi:F-type H+-transporting ATPase subunit gamma